MYSKKYYSFDPRDTRSREYSDSSSGRDSSRAAYATNTFVEPKEGQIERENYLMKEDARDVTESVTKSVVTRNVIDKRSSSSYKTREDIKAIKTRDLKGITSTYTDTSSRVNGTDENVKDSPISSFYSSYSRDEDLRDAKTSDKATVNGGDVISSFYRSGSARKMSDQRTATDEKDRDSASTSYGRNETRVERTKVTDKADLSGSLGRRSSLERRDRLEDASCDGATEDSKTIGLEDINILRRALERKEASNSLERERLATRLSEDNSSDPSKFTSSTYLCLSNKWKDKDSGSSRLSVGKSSDQYNDVTNGGRNEELFSSRRSVDSVQFPSSIKTRSLSSEALDNKARSRLGIYRELPGREEFLSYKGRARSNEDKELPRETRRTGSLERDPSRTDYTSHKERERLDSLLRSRSKSSEELRSYRKEDDDDIYPSYGSHLHGHRNTELDNALERVGTSRRDIGKLDKGSYSPRKESSTHKKLREDIARLKAEAKTRAIKKDEVISPFSFSREPSIQDKLKEDIAKLKTETLTREHVKPYIPPSFSTSRVETKDVSSRWKSREPSIHDKLKEDIAKLKAQTRDFPSLSRKASDITMRPVNKVDENENVHQSGLATSMLRRYEYSKRDGKVFKDELHGKETQRNGKLRTDDGTVPHDERTYVDRKFKDDDLSRPSGEYCRPTSDYTDPALQRHSEKDQPSLFARKLDDDWLRDDDRRLIERGDTLISPRTGWDEPTRRSRETRSGSIEGYATKRVFRADSTVSMTSTKNNDHGPSSVRGFFYGSVSDEDQSAYYSKGMGDKDTSYSREPFRRPETFNPTETSRPTEYFRTSDLFRGPQPSGPKRFPTQFEPSEKPEPSRSTESSRPTEAFRSSDLSRPQQPTGPKRSPAQSEPLGQPEPSRRTESPVPSEPYWPAESSFRAGDAIPLPYPGGDSITREREDATVSVGVLRDENNRRELAERAREVRSNQEQTTREFVTRKTTRDHSVISRKDSKDDVDSSISRLDTSRRLSERTDRSPRRTNIREEILTSHESKIFTPTKVVETIEEYKESKPSAMSELRKKIEQLKSKVDALDDSRSRGRLERYVDEHSEKKPDVEIKDPVHIPRYQPTARMPDRGSEADVAEPHVSRKSTDQISRQTSVASTFRRISSIHEDDLTTTRSGAIDEIPEAHGKPEEPAVMIQRRDVETMTAPESQEEVGTDRIRRLDSTISDVVGVPDQINELRGVPIDHRGSVPRIQEIVDAGDRTDGGMTIIEIDSQQQPLSPKKNKQRWWNAFTAEDVDQLLELGGRGQLNGYTNAYTAEDMDKLWHLGPVRRRSFRRGSYERRSFRQNSRRAKDDAVDVHVRVRGRPEKRSRPQCIIAQAAPEEKAIVLRDTKENVDPYIRKIKVDDVYGADAVRVENGVVKIKVGELTARGRKAWARILQQKDRIVESDGSVTIPISRDDYEDGVYYTNYYEEQNQDGKARIPIRFKIQEDNRLKTKKLRVTREIKRQGSMRRRRRAAGSRAYIAGARYYHGKMLMSADGYGSQARQQRAGWRTRRDNSKVTGNEIVLRRSQPLTVPMHTIQRIHEGHRTTRQATSYRDEGGNMVITVQAVPAQPPRFNLQQVGEKMSQTPGMVTSGSYYDNSNGRQRVSSTSRNYLVSSGSGGGSASQGYTMHPISGQQGTSYIVTDPSDSYRRRSSGFNGVTRVHTSNEISSTPTIVPYEEGFQSGGRPGINSDSFIVDPSSFYDARGSRVPVSDARVNARTAYGERFNLKDYGDISKVQYVNGVSRDSRIINDRRWNKGRYRYGSSWNSKQQERLNGRAMSWAVEEVAPDF